MAVLPLPPSNVESSQVYSLRFGNCEMPTICEGNARPGGAPRMSFAGDWETIGKADECTSNTSECVCCLSITQVRLLPSAATQSRVRRCMAYLTLGAFVRDRAAMLLQESSISGIIGGTRPGPRRQTREAPHSKSRADVLEET